MEYYATESGQPRGVEDAGCKIYSGQPTVSQTTGQIDRIKCFDLPVFVTWPFDRNMNNEESLALVSVSKGLTSLL